jgi:hypothetical protein
MQFRFIVTLTKHYIFKVQKNTPLFYSVSGEWISSTNWEYQCCSLAVSASQKSFSNYEN